MEWQTVLIGSGVAAAAVATKLLERDPNHGLLVLEAGPRVPSRDRRLWWDFVLSGRSAYEHCHDLPLPGNGTAETENESTGPTPWTFRESRMMGVGGSTYHWGGWSLRFKEEDFELFSRTGRGADWPISYDDLEPFYCQAETLLGTSGEDPHGWNRRSRDYPLPPFRHTAADGPMIQAFEKLGIAYASMPVARFRKCMTTGTCKYCPLGARFVASYLLDDLLTSERHANFALRDRSAVSELIFDRKDRVIGVGVLDTPTGKTESIFAERFVICAGSYESAKLLLRSRNAYWPNGAGNDAGLVGRHIISHPFLFVQGRSPANPRRLQQELDFPTLMSRHFDTPHEQRGGKLFLFRDRSKPRIDLARRMIEGRSRSQIEAELTGPTVWEIQGFMEEFANPNNRIELGQGLNRLGLPQTRIHFARADGFEQTSVERLRVMQEVIRAMGFAVGESGVQPQRGDHAASTCRMAKAPGDGVVDENLRVHGIGNLHVCSNAVFPSGAAVNPTLTVTALSLRLGEHLQPADRADQAVHTRPVALA
ncbi:MAG: GMC oxidoreductase [Pirellulales bacterium]